MRYKYFNRINAFIICTTILVSSLLESALAEKIQLDLQIGYPIRVDYPGELKIMDYDNDGKKDVVVEVAPGIHQVVYVGDIFGVQGVQMFGKRRIHYAMFDHLGSTKLLVDEEGDITWPETGTGASPNELLPFGKDMDFDPDNPDPVEAEYRLTFTNKEIDDELDLHYFGARYYNSTLPRFISPDPVNGTPKYPLSWNRYLYCRNDPINYFDPTGESTTRIDVEYDEKETLTITLIDPSVQEFRDTINSLPEGSITNLEITGHGNPKGMTIEAGESGHGIDSQNDAAGVVFTDTGKSFAELVGGKMAEGSTISLVGCNTANDRTWMGSFGSDNPIAKQLSSDLPGVKVNGSRGFGFGNEVSNPFNRDQYFRIGRENHVIRIPRNYLNGKEID